MTFPDAPRRLLATLWVVLGLAASGCPEDPIPTPEPTAAPTPVRRLTAEEIDRSLRDLFPGTTLAPITLTESPGKRFAQETSTQVVSDLHVEQLRAAVNAVSAVLVRDVDALLGQRPDAENEAAVVDAWLHQLLRRTFRRPIADADVAPYADFFAARRAAGDSLEVSLQLVLQAILQSPDFLYRLELSASGDADDLDRIPVSSVEMATRLSYFLWGTTPDDTLLDAAEAGDLATVDGLRAQAERMLDEPRAADAILSFHRQWLDFDRILETNKSPERFPQYNDFIRQAMRREADQFIALTFEEDPSLRALLTSRRTRLLPGLGAFYGVDVPFDDAVVELPEQRSGILTQAQFLAARAHAVEGSPVLRGVFVLERLICEPPPLPGGNIDTTPPQAEDDDPNAPQTNRQRYARHSTSPVCASCHQSIDGVGFGLEAFDAVGQFRTVDNGQPVDTSGTLDATRIGGDFDGAKALGAILAEDPVVHDCVARHWFRFATGRKEQSVDGPEIADLVDALETADTAIPELLLAIVTSDSFRTRRAP